LYFSKYSAINSNKSIINPVNKPLGFCKIRATIALFAPVLENAGIYNLAEAYVIAAYRESYHIMGREGKLVHLAIVVGRDYVLCLRARTSNEAEVVPR
jgi:hypothetical protein